MQLLKSFLKHSLRHGRSFRKFLNEVETTAQFSTEELESYQNSKLADTIRVAYNHVPFYRDMFRQHKLRPEDIQVKEDLRKLPFIDKDVVKKHFGNFRNKNFRGYVSTAETGGTSGSPGTFLRDLDSINFENAIVWRFFRENGKSLSSKRITIRGDIICPVDQKRPPFWQRDPFAKEILLSGYHINDTNMKLYVEQIKLYPAYDLYAYPSTAYLLAEYCLRNNVDVSFSAVFTSSEMLFGHQREKIEKAFQCKVFDWYGQVERASAIGECPHGNYHIQEDYAITEFIPTGKGLYEIVGTTLHNTVMPLIRYRTGDLVELDQDNPCACGSCFRKVKSISGREGDAIKTPDERVVGILNHIPRGVDHLIELQFEQTALDTVILRIVCTDDFSRKDKAVLLKKAREHISRDMKFIIEKVDHIKRSERGKFIPVVTHLK